MARIKYYDSDSASWKYADFAFSIVEEKTLELQNDFVEAAIGNAIVSGGTDIVLMGDQTQVGSLLHNARIMDIEAETSTDVWESFFSIIQNADTPIIMTTPFVWTDGVDTYTVIGCCQNSVTSFENASAIRVHYIAVIPTEEES